MRKTIILFASAVCFSQACMASLSIGNMPTEKPPVYMVNPYGNGNALASAKNIPLSIYMKSIYSGYKINLKNIKDIAISVKGNVPNNPVSIMEYLAKNYGLSFDVNQKKKTLEISRNDTDLVKQNTVALRSLMHSNNEMLKQNHKLRDQVSNINSSIKDSTDQLSDISKVLRKKLSGKQ